MKHFPLLTVGVQAGHVHRRPGEHRPDRPRRHSEDLLTGPTAGAQSHGYGMARFYVGIFCRIFFSGNLNDCNLHVYFHVFKPKVKVLFLTRDLEKKMYLIPLQHCSRRL